MPPLHRAALTRTISFETIGCKLTTSLTNQETASFGSMQGSGPAKAFQAIGCVMDSCVCNQLAINFCKWLFLVAELLSMLFVQPGRHHGDGENHSTGRSYSCSVVVF
jgi:hypothetical protein